LIKTKEGRVIIIFILRELKSLYLNFMKEKIKKIVQDEYGVECRILGANMIKNTYFVAVIELDESKIEMDASKWSEDF
jgi:hypothetical protein